MIERLLNDKQVLAMIRASRAPQIGSKITLEMISIWSFKHFTFFIVNWNPKFKNPPKLNIR
jgi:hypothetical protein